MTRVLARLASQHKSSLQLPILRYRLIISMIEKAKVALIIASNISLKAHLKPIGDVDEFKQLTMLCKHDGDLGY